MTVVLTQAQIVELASFAKADGQPCYTIITGTTPKFEADDGSIIPELLNLIH